MKNISKADLVSAVANNTEMKKKDVALVLDGLVQEIEEQLSEGNKVQLIGFGTFEVRHRAERKGRNPQTGAELVIPATNVPAFKPGKGLKNSVK